MALCRAAAPACRAHALPPARAPSLLSAQYPESVPEAVEPPAPVIKAGCFENNPGDWLNVMTRETATAVFGAHERYMACVGDPALVGISDQLCCGGGPTSAILDSARWSGAESRRFRFPMHLVRPWFGREFCTAPSLSIAASHGPGDFVQRCAARPLPGCPCLAPLGGPPACARAGDACLAAEDGVEVKCAPPPPSPTSSR